jgi:hypothetical protein
MANPSEPRNPFYFMLLGMGLIFIVTVLAYAVIPVLEEKAKDAGTMPPASPLRDSLREDGWKWVLIEVALIVVLGLASMGLDRWRRWQEESAKANLEKTAPPTLESPPPG